MDAERQNRSNAEHAILFEALRRKVAVPVPYGFEINVFSRIMWSSSLLRDDTSYLTKVIQSLCSLCPWIKGLEWRTAIRPMEWFRCALISFNVVMAVFAQPKAQQPSVKISLYLTVWHAIISCFSSDIFGYVRIANETICLFCLFCLVVMNRWLLQELTGNELDDSSRGCISILFEVETL